MTGEDKARATAARLKTETKVKEEKQAAEAKEAEDTLAIVAGNKELAEMYRGSASMGADNLSGSLPTLKVYQAGKSTFRLESGAKPHDGWFVYGPTKEETETVTCHVLTISRGFRAPGLNTDKLVFNQILGGVWIDDGALKPFVMFFTGKKLQNLWTFGKEVAPYTKAKPVPIPMFALTVKLSAHSEANDYGESWLVDFKILRNEAGQPDLVMDPQLFAYLRDHVKDMEETIEKLIESKSSEQEEDGVIEGRPVDASGKEEDPASGTEEVHAEEIPF